ncbi:putative DNA-damage-inducible protein F [Aurantiacibacter atlanticus]|uniref:Putative DNA-damage-inducible protein F n=1 Tax=Aurantiacibacter atlanticus TaxID=1648404 RepID=A0A0H4VFL8_9SPHN|nr:MATE family efflux transporter [Aurantiacibacter atlanticus]AKQ41894.1 putative DNA-damage-inducible protein F [Aurantiacibacter atlanticus]MDF1834007.1 MATE family efflux transporter [Alteraurantiacibacter sp. bin_em_oilr2.035]
MNAAHPLTRASIFTQAWPIMLGQASVPLVGIVDTAVIGRTGDATALAGVALGATIINLVFWTFGFLRMGMTGLTAQANGSGDPREVDALLLRALGIGFALGVAVLALSAPIGQLAFAIMAGSDAVTSEAAGYMQGRFYGAPAALAVYAMNGWLLGLGRTREALALQIAMNLANVALDIWFVWGLDMGTFGVGLGTACAEWLALALGLVIMSRVAGANLIALTRRTPRALLFDRTRLLRLFAVNRDIMIRTIALLLLFAWFANAGARIGAAALAANHVLLQFVNVAAFILDAFAFTAEERVGRAYGARDRQQFMRSIRLTSEFALASGVVFALAFLLAGDAVIDILTTDAQVRAEARRFLPFAALVPLVGMPSWMLDGIFIGTTRGRALRNAGIAATILYVALDYSLRPLDNWGVWIAITASYLLRAGGLALYFPGLLREIKVPTLPGSIKRPETRP